MGDGIDQLRFGTARANVAYGGLFSEIDGCRFKKVLGNGQSIQEGTEGWLQKKPTVTTTLTVATEQPLLSELADEFDANETSLLNGVEVPVIGRYQDRCVLFGAGGKKGVAQAKAGLNLPTRHPFYEALANIF